MTLRDSSAHMDDTIPDTCEDCGGDGGWYEGGGRWVVCACVHERNEQDERDLREAVKAHNRAHGRPETWDGVL